MDTFVCVFIALEKTRPWCCKTFVMLNVTEHEISAFHKVLMLKNVFVAKNTPDVVFILLINVKLSTILGILTEMRILNIIFS